VIDVTLIYFHKLKFHSGKKILIFENFKKFGFPYLLALYGSDLTLEFDQKDEKKVI